MPGHCLRSLLHLPPCCAADPPLQDLQHKIQADHISNCCPISEGVKEGETTSELGRQELLELHARVAFRGLRMKRMEVGVGAGPGWVWHVVFCHST